MKIYNTLTKKKEEFVPLEEGKVKMYVCGPTVYNFIHIGNARPMIVFDTVRRYMEYKGYDVNYVSNFTDVDDKIIAKAIEEGVSAEEISKRYIAECKKDMADMNVKPATTHPLATQEIDGMIEKHCIGWTKNRLSRVAVSVLRTAVYEMLYEEKIPVSVSINEAVEIAKTYGSTEDASFVNGVLGSVAKELESAQ